MSAYDFIEAVKESPKISPESRNRLEEVQFYSEYAEPGCTDPESGIIAVGNWNNADKRNPDYDPAADFHTEQGRLWIKADDYVSRVARVLEKRYGAELEWCDEWCGCSECSKLIRTSPDCYSWSPSYYVGDGEILCSECAKEHADTILEECEGNERKALTRNLGIDPGDHGYVQILDKLESGLHEHMAADPKVIAKSLREKGVGRFLFRIDEQSQFYTTFSCWVHKDELEKVEATAGSLKTDADVSPATLMKQALSQASVQSAEIGDAAKEGVLFKQIQGDGTAKTTVIKHSDLRRCPSLILSPEHYNADGSCKCNQPAADVQQPNQERKQDQ